MRKKRRRTWMGYEVHPPVKGPLQTVIYIALANFIIAFVAAFGALAIGREDLMQRTLGPWAISSLGILVGAALLGNAAQKDGWLSVDATISTFFASFRFGPKRLTKTTHPVAYWVNWWFGMLCSAGITGAGIWMYFYFH